MTSDNLKRAIRAYMAEHGVNYTTAKRAVSDTGASTRSRQPTGDWVLGDVLAAVRARLASEVAREVWDGVADFMAELAEFPSEGEPEHPGLLKRSVNLGDYVVPVQMPYVLTLPGPLVEERWWESDGTPAGDARAAQPGVQFLAAAIPRERVGYRLYDNTFATTSGLRTSAGLVNPHGVWRPENLELCNPEQQRLIGSWRDSDGDTIALIDALQGQSEVIFDVAHVVEDLCADFPASYRAHHVAGSAYLDHAEDPTTRQMLSTASDPTGRYLYDKALRHFLIAVGIGSAALGRGPLGDPEGPYAAGAGSVLDTSVALPWHYLHNRPFLRSLFGAAWTLQELGEISAARYLYQQCLGLCPQDALIAEVRLDRLNGA